MSTITTTHPFRRKKTTAALIAVGVGVVALTTTLLLGPRPVAVEDERTGDPHLAARLADLAEPGHHQLATFTILDSETIFAGLGADRHVEFEIGSISKIFTAEILRNQIAAGRIAEDTTVGEIIDAGDAPVADVTLRELADHTSGLPRLAGVGAVRLFTAGLLGQNPYEGIGRGDIIDAALAAELSGRGEEEYSNFGVSLLGHLLAIEADTTYGELVGGHILEPLGMMDTYVMTEGAVPHDAPRGHTGPGRGAEPWESGGYAPAGGLRSTAADMALFARHLLDQGLPGFTWAGHDAGYHWHNGGTYGYSAMLIVDPDTGRAAFAAGDTMTSVEELAAGLIGEEF